MNKSLQDSEASPHWAAEQGHQHQSGFLFLLAKGFQFSNFHYCYIYNIFSLLCLQYLTHPHPHKVTAAVQSFSFMHWVVSSVQSRTYPADKSQEFSQDILRAFNINTSSASSFPSHLLQSQHRTEGYLSKKTQYTPLCVSQKASQLRVRSQWAILSSGEPEAQVFVLR